MSPLFLEFKIFWIFQGKNEYFLQYSPEKKNISSKIEENK